MDELDAIAALIADAQNKTYDQAAADATGYEAKAMLKACWQRLDAAAWCIRQLSGKAGTPTLEVPMGGPFYGARRVEA